MALGDHAGQRLGGIQGKTKQVAEPLGSRKSDLFGIDLRISDDCSDQIFLVFATHDGKARWKPYYHRVPSQQPVPNRMKRPTPNRSRFQREQSLHASKHLASGLVRESKQQNILWLNAVVEQPGDAIGQCPSFSASGPREY